MATSGNPTILEIIWSNQIIETTTEFQELKANSLKLLDDFKIYNAHLGYSQNQIKKMGFDESNSKNIRTYKTVIAYIRSLRQGRELLETGSFNPVYEYPDRDFLMELKTDFKTEMMGKAATIMKQVREEFEETFNNLKQHRKPDLEWIEDFILRTYLEKS
jgi:ribosomal protein S16